MNKVRYLPLAIIAVLLSWLAFLLYKSQSIDTTLHTKTVSSIQQLNHFDGLLNQDILEVRYLSQLNMDVISNHAEQTLKLISDMKELFTNQSIKPYKAFTEAESLLTEKVHLIEQFKSHNGVLRNSLRYLPGAVDELTGSAIHHSHDLDKLIEMILTYNLSPESVVKNRILLLLEQLSSFEDGGKSDAHRHIIKHAHVVLREHMIVSNYLHRLLALPTTDLITYLYDAYDSEYKSAIDDAATYRIFLFIFLILLILYVVYLFRQQSKTAFELKQMLQDLKFQKYALDQHAIVAIADKRGDITYANPKLQKISQYSSDELVGSNHNIVHSACHSSEISQAIWCTVRHGNVWHGEIHNKSKDGTSYWVDTTIVPFLDNSGEPFQYIAIRTDITRMRNTREQLRKGHELLERVLSAIPSILIGVNAEGEINLWNLAAEKTFGIKQCEAQGSRLFDCHIDWDKAEIDKAIVVSRNLGESKLEHFKYKRRDGSDGFLGITINSIHEAGMDAGFLFLASDITERTQLESQLRLSQKMEAVGELAAGIAHEINTPLQYIGDNLRFLKNAFEDMELLCDQFGELKHHCKDGGVAPDLVAQITRVYEKADIEFLFGEIPAAISQSLDGIKRAGGIVGAMKEFSHPGVKDMVLTDINRAIESTIMVSKNEWKYVAEMETQLDENLPLVSCLPEINQVFLNMIVNATHAIEDKQLDDSQSKGAITIRTSYTDVYAQIEISDTGKGMSEEVCSKIYDPFFTTKEVGKGTGQGLSISHNIIVEQHGGELCVDSEIGKGTTFMIRIPLSQSPVENNDG